MHGWANWDEWQGLAGVFQPQIIRVWQRCDHRRSYHAWRQFDESQDKRSLPLLHVTFHSLGNVFILLDGFILPRQFMPFESFPENPPVVSSVNTDQHSSANLNKEINNLISSFSEQWILVKIILNFMSYWQTDKDSKHNKTIWLQNFVYRSLGFDVFIVELLSSR